MISDIILDIKLFLKIARHSQSICVPRQRRGTRIPHCLIENRPSKMVLITHQYFGIWAAAK
ncbi:MAG: hypothetical protein EAZ23_06080 [Oscillatoriales cyanobacterium]|nr:MAG: hypothetical protein EAZ23_06080 [Oscillatoriales cyanobacterium]